MLGQWGDEGKGKLSDVLAKNYDIVGRFNGGDNAGHTVRNPRGYMNTIVQVSIPVGGRGRAQVCLPSCPMWYRVPAHPERSRQWVRRAHSTGKKPVSNVFTFNTSSSVSLFEWLGLRCSRSSSPSRSRASNGRQRGKHRDVLLLFRDHTSSI